MVLFRLPLMCTMTFYLTTSLLYWTYLPGFGCHLYLVKNYIYKSTIYILCILFCMNPTKFYFLNNIHVLL